MSGVWTAIAIGAIAVTTGAVVSHDIKVKKNRAEGAIKDQAKALQDQIDAQVEDDAEGVVADVKKDQERRRRNLRRINPTGSRGVRNDDGATSLTRMANNTRQTFPSGRSRLLGN